MSADEIRRLADKIPVGVKGGRHGRAYETEIVLPEISMFDRMEISSALLSYAAMVERCEELLQKLRPYRDEDVIGTLNYILRGDAEEGGAK